MALTKNTKVDQITVMENGVVLYREVTQVYEDDVELSKTFHRFSLTPGQNISDVPANVQEICAMTWTPGVIQAYKEAQAAAIPFSPA